MLQPFLSIQYKSNVLLTPGENTDLSKCLLVCSTEDKNYVVLERHEGECEQSLYFKLNLHLPSKNLDGLFGRKLLKGSQISISTLTVHPNQKESKTSWLLRTTGSLKGAPD